MSSAASEEENASEFSFIESLLKTVCKSDLQGKCIKDLNCTKTHIKDEALRTKLLEHQKLLRKPVSKPVPKQIAAAATESTRAQASFDHECSQLLLKYKDDLTVEQVDDGSGRKTLVLNHEITDPDFPYDLPSLLIQIDVPSSYPAACPLFRVLNSELPSAIVQNINNYLETTAPLFKGQCCIKAVLNALEKNLESLMILRKTASSVKIVSFNSASSPPSGQHPDASKRTFLADFKNLSIEPAPDANAENELKLHKFVNPAIRSFPVALPPGFSLQSTRVVPSVRYLNNISFLLLLHAEILVKCSRCQAQNVFEAVSAGTTNKLNCVKCDRLIVVEFYAELLHKTAPNLCWIQTKNGSVFSVTKCFFQIECANCDDFEFEGKLINILHVSGVNCGDRVATTCRNCRQKLNFSFETLEFVSQATEGAGSSKIKQQKTPGLLIGQPLPEKGTCKHYRKSFRWLRFSCCGKIFPCDTCHDEGTSDGHKTQWATRQICGHCSREQAFSNTKCTCGEYPTDVRTTAHWEGGKGSRNVVTMSKKDPHKYRNMTKSKKDPSSASPSASKPKPKPK